MDDTENGLREYAKFFGRNFKDTVDHQIDMFTESVVAFLRASRANGVEIGSNSPSVDDLTLSNEIKRLTEESDQLKAELKKSKAFVSSCKKVIALLNTTIAKTQKKEVQQKKT